MIHLDLRRYKANIQAELVICLSFARGESDVWPILKYIRGLHCVCQPHT